MKIKKKLFLILNTISTKSDEKIHVHYWEIWTNIYKIGVWIWYSKKIPVLNLSVMSRSDAIFM